MAFLDPYPSTPGASTLTEAPAAASYAAAPAGKRLLLVDDDEGVRSSFGRYLRSRGYPVEGAGSAEEALDRLQQTRFALALCDVRLPGMSGVELVSRARSVDPDLAVLMLSAVNDAPTAAAAMANGAADYLMKPVAPVELLQAIERALHRRDLSVEQRRVEQVIREEVAQRTAEVEHEKSALRGLTLGVAETLINAMEAKDVYLRGHSQRVAALAAETAEELGLDPDTVEDVRLAGRLHDVGKIGIRESVLNKPGKLTPEEYAHVQDHVRIGMEILAPLRHLGHVLAFVQDHHEHWDGHGYPRGLTGETISIGGRILNAVDAFDALTSRRAYRESMSPTEALHYLGTMSGQLVDPAVYAALSTVMLRGQSLSLTFIDDVPE